MCMPKHPIRSFRAHPAIPRYSESLSPHMIIVSRLGSFCCAWHDIDFSTFFSVFLTGEYILASVRAFLSCMPPLFIQCFLHPTHKLKRAYSTFCQTLKFVMYSALKICSILQPIPILSSILDPSKSFRTFLFYSH